MLGIDMSHKKGLAELFSGDAAIDEVILSTPYPNLKIILGHLGEGLPFSLWRIDHAFKVFSRPDVEPVPIRELFSEHFWITTSGNFSNPALLCSVMELGIDRILFSVDWPYIENMPGTEWMKGVPLSQEDRVKMLNGNAKRLLKM